MIQETPKDVPSPWTAALFAVPGIPLIQKGDDLAAVISDKAEASGFRLADRDVVVVASKIVSKAEGLIVCLDDVTPTPRALELSEATGRDPRLCELILRESAEVLGTNGRMIITRHRLGFRCTNAGVDRSNVSSQYDDFAITLPADPDASARAIRQGIFARARRRVAVVISDSFGLPDRAGAVSLAIGIAGIRPLEERESEDLYGRPMHSALMLVDALAGAAAVLMGETDEALPVVVIRGARYTEDDEALIGGLLVPAAEQGR